MKRNKEIKSIAIRLICLSLLLNLFSVNTLWGRTKVTSIEKKSPETIDIRYKSVFGDKKIILRKGLLEIVFCENEIYIEIPDSLLNKDFIMGTSVVSTSSTRESWEGVRPQPYISVSFAKVGKNIHLEINRKRIFNSSIKSDYPNENE